MPTPTRAAQNGAATDAAAITQRSTVAGDIVTRSTATLTSIVRFAAGKARELFDGCAAEFTKITGLTDASHERDFSLGDPTAWV